MLTQDVTKPVCGYLPRVQGDWPPSLFVQAFSHNTWYVLSAFLVLFTVSFAVTLHVETKVIVREEGGGGGAGGQDDAGGGVDGQDAEGDDEQAMKSEEAANPEHWEGSEILLLTVGAVCQQGCWRHPETLAARLVFLQLFLMAVLCFVAFSAAVTSLVSSERNLDAPSLDALLQRPTTVLALQDSPYFRRALVAADARLLPLRRGLRALLSGGATVLCADAGDLQDEVVALRADLWCQLQTTEFTLPLAAEPLQQNGSSWRAELRRLEVGLWTRERRRRSLPDAKELCRARAAGVIPVSLADVWLALALLAGGVVAAVVLGVGEALRSWGGARTRRWAAKREAERRAARTATAPASLLPYTD